jgi:hypothetical protein
MPAAFESRLKLCRALVTVFLVTLPGIIVGVEQSVGRFRLPFEIPSWLVGLLAGSALSIGFWACVKFVRPAERALRSKAGDASLPRWQVRQPLCRSIPAPFTLVSSPAMRGCSSRAREPSLNVTRK